MTYARRGAITDALRNRLLGGISSGAIGPGVRLPSTREIAADLDADPRVVAAAYRTLEAEGLVELRPRSGVFVAPSAAKFREDRPGTAWAVDALAAGLAQGIPMQAAAERLRTLSSVGLANVVVAATMADQVDGLVRELKQDFGFAARGLLIDPVSRIDRWPRALERADLVLTTAGHAERFRRLDRGTTRAVVIAGVSAQLVTAEWRLLASGICYIVVADPRFATVVREFLRQAGVTHDVPVRIAGRDWLGDIPPDAPTYITEAARRVIGRTRLPGRVIRPARILDDASTRRILAFVVARNSEVSQASDPAPPRRTHRH